MTDLHEMAQTIRANFSIANAAGRGTDAGEEAGRTSRSGVPPVFAEDSLACSRAVDVMAGGNPESVAMGTPTPEAGA